jgi:quinolinate synthase
VTLSKREARASLVSCTIDEDGELALVPSVADGEGCSTAGGCATCPFMKMNDLDALLDVLEMAAQQEGTSSALQRHLPPDRLSGKMIDGRSATELGSEVILYMRAFMKDQRLPEERVKHILR